MSRKPVVTRPERVRIFGRDYAITYILPTRLGEEALGLCDNQRQTISVADWQSPIEEADTVLHEVIHGIDYVTGLGLEERQVRHLAAGLIGVLQDNPELAKWLIEEKNVPSIRKRASRPAQRVGKGSQDSGPA